MRKIKVIALGTVAVLGLVAQGAMAAEQRAETYYQSTRDKNKTAAMESFLEYEQREPCQNYRSPPSGYYYDGCHLVRRQKIVMQEPSEPAETVAQIEPAAGNVLADYKVNFDYDDATIDMSDKDLLDQVAYEIKQYNPKEVVVSGYADAAGTPQYNERLSQRRANSLSQALNERGLENRIIDRKAYGESNLAVETPDGVALRENRRATVQFMQ